MAVDPQKQSEAEQEFRKQREEGTAQLVFRRSFSPKAGTDVTHYSWYSTNGLCAKVVETKHMRARPSLTITDWSDAPSTKNIHLQT